MGSLAWIVAKKIQLLEQFRTESQYKRYIRVVLGYYGCM